MFPRIFARISASSCLLIVTAALIAAPPQTVTVPAGTHVHIKLRQSINTATAKAGEEVPAELTQAIVVGGKTIAHAGAPAVVHVSTAEGSGRIGGSAKLVFSVSSIKLANGETAAIHTSSYAREGKAHVKHNAEYIVGGALAGALAGQAVGGNHKATEKGTAIGAGVGIAAAAATGKFDFEEKAGSRYNLTLRKSFKATI